MISLKTKQNKTLLKNLHYIVNRLSPPLYIDLYRNSTLSPLAVSKNYEENIVGMTKDEIPNFTRTSKLKRRRRNPSNNKNHSTNSTLENNPLKRFAAEPVVGSKFTSDTSSSTDAVTNNTITTNNIPRYNDPSGGDISLGSTAALSTILNLDEFTSRDGENRNMKWGAKMIAAQIDYYIAASCQYTLLGTINQQEQQQKEHHHRHHQQQQPLQQLYGMQSIPHPATLGVMRVQNQNEDESILKRVSKDFCPIAFPQFNLPKSETVSKHSSFQSRGVYGTVVDLNKMRLFTQSSSSRKHLNACLKYIKIVSTRGATIRRNHDIDENRNEPSSPRSSATTSSSSDIIGKLTFGSIRPVVECKWLEKPPLFSIKKVWSEDDGCWHEEEASDVELDEELVGVMRYKVCLLPSDIINHNNSSERDDNEYVASGKMYGWISDRSRLQSHPYRIAELIE